MHVKIIRGNVTFPSDLNPSNYDIFRGFGGFVNKIHVKRQDAEKDNFLKIHVNRLLIGIWNRFFLSISDHKDMTHVYYDHPNHSNFNEKMFLGNMLIN